MFSPHSEHDILGRIVVAIDGPAGSGKTTTARETAKRLGLRHIDTGAMYRAVTWKLLHTGVDPRDELRVGEVSSSIDIAFSGDPQGGQRVAADGVDVTDGIRSLEVTANVSLVSSYAVVRQAMVRLQRRLSRSGGVVLEGRDIGSVVLPDADVKVFLDASAEERARRRLREFQAKGIDKNVDEVRADIERRDLLDSSREISPLTIPVGAHVIDTTRLTIGEQVTRVVEIARETSSFLFSRVVERGDRNPYSRERFGYRFGREVIRSLAVLLFGLRVVRKHELDLAENYIYASNHRSNVDPPFVGSTIRRETHYMAKDTLFRVPVLAGLIRWYNAIPTRRGAVDREALRSAVDVLDRGGSLLVFPEGTRIRGGELGKEKPGVGYLALSTGVPVVPVYVRGTGCLKRAVFRRPRLIVAHGRPIRLMNREKATPTGDNYREFARMVMAAIDALRDEVETE